MLRWTRRVVLFVAVFVVLVLCTGVAYEQWARRSVARDFPPPGVLIEYKNKLSHLHCTGEGAPTVVLEAGHGVAGSLAWASVQPGIAADTRVCSYDRAGILWSEPRDEPRDAAHITEELHGLLEAALESPPYVMVGHSLGGLLVRVFADRFPSEVAGVVFVDAAHPEQFDRYPAKVREFLSEAESSLPSPRLFRLWTAVGAYRFRLDTPQNAVQAFLPRTIPWGFLGERMARDATAEQAAESEALGDRPLIVLTAGVGPRYPGVQDAALREFYDTWLALQAELASLSTNSDHRVIEGATHNIQRDDPEAVIAAVRDVVNAVRQGATLARVAGAQAAGGTR